MNEDRRMNTPEVAMNDTAKHAEVLRDMLANEYAQDESVGMIGFREERAALQAAIVALTTAAAGEGLQRLSRWLAQPNHHPMDTIQLSLDEAREILAAPALAPAGGVYWMGEEIKTTARLVEIVKAECTAAMDHVLADEPLPAAGNAGAVDLVEAGKFALEVLSAGRRKIGSPQDKAVYRLRDALANVGGSP